MTSDPIGLLGGGNTFGYVGGNPLRYSDPYGLCVGPFIVPCGYFVANAPAINTFFIVTAELLAGVGIASTAGKVVHGVAKSSVNAAKQCFIKGFDDATKGALKFPSDVVTAGARKLANRAFLADPSKAKAFRELIPTNQKQALAKHFDNIADANFAKRGSGIQVDLQRARARFLRGDTNIPPGNASNFNPASLGK